MVAGADAYQVCTLQERHDDSYSHIAFSDAHPLRNSFDTPFDSSVHGADAAIRYVLLGVPQPAKGHCTSDMAYLESDSVSDSLRVSSLGLDLHENKQRLGPTDVTRPSGDDCSTTALPSSPRRSVEFSGF